MAKKDVTRAWDILSKHENDKEYTEFDILAEYNNQKGFAEISETIDRLNNWIDSEVSYCFSSKADVQKIQSIFGFREEMTQLCVPKPMLQKVLELEDQIKQASSFRKKKYIFSQIKQFLVPIPIRYHINYELALFPVYECDYSPAVGCYNLN